MVIGDLLVGAIVGLRGATVGDLGATVGPRRASIRMFIGDLVVFPRRYSWNIRRISRSHTLVHVGDLGLNNKKES